MIPTLSLFQVRVSKFAILLGDALAFAVAFALATLINVALDPSGNIGVWFSTQDMQRYAAWSGLVFLGLMLFLMRFQHYSDRRPFWDELGDVLRLVGILAVLDMTLIAATRWNSSRLWWLLVWVLACIAIVWGRVLTRWVLRQMGLWIRPTIIIGHGENATEAAIALQSEPRMGFQVAGYVDVDASKPELQLNGRTLQNLKQLETLADQPGIQWVIALEHSQSEQREHWLRTLTQWGATDISVIPAMRGVPLYGTDIAHFFSHEVALLRVRNNLRRWPARLTKRLFDTSLAAVLILLV
jgi:FlaA1/EpsC-like NDP-sugar epimerase